MTDRPKKLAQGSHRARTGSMSTVLTLLGDVVIASAVPTAARCRISPSWSIFDNSHPRGAPCPGAAHSPSVDCFCHLFPSRRRSHAACSARSFSRNQSPYDKNPAPDTRIRFPVVYQDSQTTHSGQRDDGGASASSWQKDCELTVYSVEGRTGNIMFVRGKVGLRAGFPVWHTQLIITEKSQDDYYLSL